MYRRGLYPSTVVERAFRFAATVACCVVLAGCGSSEPAAVPVTGTLKFKDGTVPQGEIAMIRFEPMIADGSCPAAFAKIQSDGNYSLETADGKKGALPGNYKVTLKIWRTYRPPHVSVVPEKYAHIETSNLEREVSEAGPNHFDLVVDSK